MGWRRLGLLIPATALAVLTVALYHITDNASNDLMPMLWVGMLGTSAVLVVAVAVNPRSRLLFNITGAMLMTAISTRPLGVLANYLVGYLPDGWGVVAAFVVYPSWALTAGLVWFWWVGRWQQRHEVGATVGGD